MHSNKITDGSQMSYKGMSIQVPISYFTGLQISWMEIICSVTQIDSGTSLKTLIKINKEIMQNCFCVLVGTVNWDSVSCYTTYKRDASSREVS